MFGPERNRFAVYHAGLRGIPWKVGVKKVKCQRFEFTGEIISSAVPNEVEGKRSGHFMVFPIRATCKISKNYAPELRNCIWIESK